MSERNILMTTLSKKVEKDCYDYYEAINKKDNKKTLYCTGYCAMEPGSKYLLSKYENRINEIIVVGTEQTIGKHEEDKIKKYGDHFVLEERDLESEWEYLDNKYQHQEELSPFEFYLYSILLYIWHPEKKREGEDRGPQLENKNAELMKCDDRIKRGIIKLKVHFVLEQIKVGKSSEKVIDNISGIVKRFGNDDNAKINLYIDAQGGIRTSFYVRNAVLSILNNQYGNNFNVRQIVATNFPLYEGEIKYGEIVDETVRYQISDLVSGMNAFIRYGKADMIKKYCDDIGDKINSNIKKLVENMVEIDRAISICDVNSMKKAIANIKEVIDNNESYESEGDSSECLVDDVFRVLAGEIKEDYKELLDIDEKNYDLKVISWCANKGFIQQALTLIEVKMPELYLNPESGIMKFEITDRGKTGTKEGYILSLKPHGKKDLRSDENAIFYKTFLHHNEMIRKKMEDELIDAIMKIFEDTEEGAKELIDKFEAQSRKQCGIKEEKHKKHNHKKTNKLPKDEEIKKKIKKDKENQKYYNYIVGFSGEMPYGSNEKKKTVDVKFSLSNNIKELNKAYLNRLIALHFLLKEQRNNCNHASDRESRPSDDQVVIDWTYSRLKAAITVYVKYAGDLLADGGSFS